MFLTRLARSSLLLAALAVVACDDDDDPTDPPGTVTLSVSRSALDVTAGASDTLTVTIARSGGFTGAVDLSIEGAPTGVTAALATPTLTPTQTSSAVTITVVAAVAPGAYPLIVRAEGDGVTDRETTVTLTVIAPTVAGFTLAATPDTVNIAQGGTANSLVTLTRTGGFADTVAITADSLPAGVTAAVGTPSLGGDTTTVVLTADTTAAAGTFSFFITGTADTTVRTDTVTIVVGSAVAGAFSLATTPDTINIAPGATANSLVTLTRTGGFADTVTITADSLPAGVTAAIGTPALAGDTTTVVLSADSTAAVGTFTFFITGTADTTVRTDTVTMILAAAVAGFSLAATPDTVSITQGATANSLVTLTRTGGFADTVTITTDSLPTGVTAAIGTPALAGDTTTVVLTASATATAGTFRFFITGTVDSTVSTDTVTIIVASSITGAIQTNDPLRLVASAPARRTFARLNADRPRTLEPLRRSDLAEMFE